MRDSAKGPERRAYIEYIPLYSNSHGMRECHAACDSQLSGKEQTEHFGDTIQTVPCTLYYIVLTSPRGLKMNFTTFFKAITHNEKRILALEALWREGYSRPGHLFLRL